MKIYKWPVVHECLFLASALFSTNIGFSIIGALNKAIFRRRLNNIFVLYTVDKDYLKTATRSWYSPIVKWRPSIVGFFLYKQSGAVMVGISATEADFENPANADKLHALQKKVEYWSHLLGAKHHSYAGILPSVLHRVGVRREPVEADLTAAWSVRALNQLCLTLQYPLGTTPVVIIGSDGFIGRRVAEDLSHRWSELVEIDVRQSRDEAGLRSHLATCLGRPTVFLNFSRAGVLGTYAPLLWPGAIILDDVYPECALAVRLEIKAAGARYFHLAGVNGFSFPRLTRAYENAIPFCAVSGVLRGEDASQSDDRIVMNETEPS